MGDFFFSYDFNGILFFLMINHVLASGFQIKNFIVGW